MDITTLFKACVKTLKTRSKALGIEKNEDKDKNRILRTRRKNEFIVKTKDLVTQITQLRDFLLEHRKAYLNFTSGFLQPDNMSDMERDKIDSWTQHIIKACSQMISNFKRDVYAQDDTSQMVENQKAIIDLIEAYLKTVCKIYTEQKAIRVKWTVEFQKMSKLETDKITNLPVKEPVVKDPAEIEKSTKNIGAHIGDTYSEEHTLTEEEMQMFEMENQVLYNELNSLNEEVRDIQSKVVRIAELQEVFTEKVLEQNEDIERIGNTLVGTTENLKDANTQIRQAIQSNAGLRIYILFFLLVMSFTLLFLDWYND